MAIINIKPDCGNAPKKAFLKDFNIAFAEGDEEFIVRYVNDNIEWNILGDRCISGKNEFIKAIQEMTDYKAEMLTIHQIITHGAEAAVHGEMVMKGNRKYAFCDVYQFTTAAKNEILKMHSYVISVK